MPCSRSSTSRRFGFSISTFSMESGVFASVRTAASTVSPFTLRSGPLSTRAVLRADFMRSWNCERFRSSARSAPLLRGALWRCVPGTPSGSSQARSAPFCPARTLSRAPGTPSGSSQARICLPRREGRFTRSRNPERFQSSAICSLCCEGQILHALPEPRAVPVKRDLLPCCEEKIHASPEPRAVPVEARFCSRVRPDQDHGVSYG